MKRERGKHVGQIIAGEFSINILHLCSLTIPLLFSMTIIIDTEVITKNQLFLSTAYKKANSSMCSLCMSYDLPISIILQATYILHMADKGVTTKSWNKRLFYAHRCIPIYIMSTKLKLPLRCMKHQKT